MVIALARTWPRYLHLLLSDRDRDTRKQRVIWSRKCLMACFASESEQRQGEPFRKTAETASSMQRACRKIEAIFSHKQEGSGQAGGGGGCGAGLTDNDMRGFMACSVSAPELDSVTGNGVVKS